MGVRPTLGTPPHGWALVTADRGQAIWGVRVTLRLTVPQLRPGVCTRRPPGGGPRGAAGPVATPLVQGRAAVEQPKLTVLASDDAHDSTPASRDVRSCTMNLKKHVAQAAIAAALGGSALALGVGASPASADPGQPCWQDCQGDHRGDGPQ